MNYFRLNIPQNEAISVTLSKINCMREEKLENKIQIDLTTKFIYSHGQELFYKLAEEIKVLDVKFTRELFL